MRHVKRSILGILAAALLVFTGEPQAATLTLDGSGRLIAAHGVLVGGTAYNVSFHDDTCIALFSGCDNDGDFAFHDSTGASVAAQALLDQVFLDLLVGTFDSHPERTLGCENAFSCTAFVPYAGDGASTAYGGAVNATIQASDGVISGATSAANDLATVDNATWAVFTRVAASEPGTVGLTMLSLVALFARRRR